MSSCTRFALLLLTALLGVTAGNAKADPGPSAAVPAPVVDASRSATAAQQTAVISGGCFWGVQQCFST
jgi:peptide-methionine (S)-S-oxide reductase